MWTFSWWEILCLLALYCYVCHCQDENNCLPNYSAFGCRTCFRVFDAQSDVRNFDSSQQFCQAQGASGGLVTFKDMKQISLLSTYLNLNDINEKLWVGMSYVERNGNIVLVDVNDNTVDSNITFAEGTAEPAVGLCVSMMSGGDGTVSLVREECDNSNSFVCTVSSIELEITSFTSNPDGYGIRDGQVTFSCQFSPIPDPGITVIQWYRNNEMVATTGANEDYSISSFQPSDSGNYSCSVLVMIGSVVLGGATSVEKSVRLAVAPTLSRPPQSAAFHVQRTAYLECGVDGTTFPPPLVQWYKDSVLVDYSGRNFFSPNTKSLIITNIRAEDSGRYTCEVSNVAGRITHSANLTVLDGTAADVAILLNPMSVTAEVGSNVTFDCVVQDNSANPGFVQYQWNIVNSAGGFMIGFKTLSGISHLSSLTITDVQFTTNISGVWCVSGTQGGGGSLLGSKVANLTLVEPARITEYSSDPTVLLSDTAELWCRFKGTPSPRVQWYFKGGLVPDQHIITTVPSNKTVHGMTTLTINNFQFQDIGSYRCVVSNYLQSVYQEFNLCGESDVPDVVSNVRAKTISQTQVKVYWKPPANVNSDPSLLRYRVYWDLVSKDTVLTVDNARNYSSLIPFIENGYIISGLYPADSVAVIVTAVSYIGQKTMGVEVANNQTFGKVPKEVPIPMVNRTNNGKDLYVMWDHVTPNLTAGEAYVYSYEIRYYRYNDVNNSYKVPVKNVTHHLIEGVDEDVQYIVEVRAAVLKSIEPTLLEYGEWSETPTPKQIEGDVEGPVEEDSNNTVIIAIVVIIVCLILIVLIVGCMLWCGYRRVQRGHYYPAKAERQKGTTLSVTQNKFIYNNDAPINPVDNSGLHSSSTNGKCEV